MTEPVAVETTVDPEAMRAVARRWWLVALIGAITAILGIIVIVRPIAGEVALAVFIAAGFIVSGLGDLVAAGRWPRPWVPVVWGIVSLGAGVVTIVWPEITLEIVAIIIGVLLIVRGVIAAMSALVDRPAVWGLWLVLGLVEVAIGVAAIAWPAATILVLAVIIGIDLLIAGIVQLVIGFGLRSLR
jgi:uncharacterized membrane protein HdeD (DUF308 family)